MSDKTKQPEMPANEATARTSLEVPEAFMLNVNRALTAPLSQMIASIQRLGHVCLDEGGGYMAPGQREAAAQELARLSQVSYRLLRLSCNIRDMARFQRGEEIVEPRWIDFSVLCKKICGLADLAAGDGSVVLTQTSEKPILLNGDAALLERVVYNLLVNALLSRSEGETVICTLSESGGKTALRIQGGRGLSSRELEHLYDAYDRAPSLDDSPEAGLALGLPLCKHIVERHGGVLLPSTGDSTSVTISLPLGERDPDEVLPLGQPESMYTGLPIHLVELSVLPIGSRLYRRTTDS